MDKLSPVQRHKNMAAIRSRDTRPELIVRRWLWSRGFRYRLNSPRLPGHPDLVLKKYRTCIFVNGCFWHGHGNQDLGVGDNELDVRLKDLEVGDGDVALLHDSDCFRLPKTNRAFWTRKIVRNIRRDAVEQRLLAGMGWHCITIWECELKPAVRQRTLTALEYTLNRIFLHDHAAVYPQHDEESGLGMAAEPVSERRY